MAAEKIGRAEPPAARPLQLEDLERALAAADDQTVGDLSGRKGPAIDHPDPPDLEFNAGRKGRGARRRAKGAYGAFEALPRMSPVDRLPRLSIFGRK
jgi:hypothetical protein